MIYDRSTRCFRSPVFDESLGSEWVQDADWSPRYPIRSSYPPQYYEEPIAFPPYLTKTAFTRWVFEGESPAGRGRTAPGIPRYKRWQYKHVPYSWDWRFW